VDHLVMVLLQVLVSLGNLVLISLGLAIVFGMMRIINFAHGEFLMLGAYSAIMSHQAGVNIWVSIFLISPLVVGLIGIAVERLVIRHLYGRMIDTMLATWGISLALIGIVSVVFGNTVSGISTPLGSIKVGEFSISLYEMLLVAVALLLLAAGWWVLGRTSIGLIARATMQDRSMAAALGVDPKRVYAVTFATGAMVTGLVGGLFAPITGALPTIGATYLAKAFITVILGGEAILTGTVAAATLLGGIGTVGTFLSNPVLGEAALLVTAVVLLRLLPKGITGRFLKKAL
jgi:urea transport system permease protein